ncbi:HTH DNA binding protein [Lactococcus phage 936 group phage Phi4.2]|uniref:HNH endonuclease n=2 Tax=Skunavirus sv42 TaxID=2845445 RepID=A0A126HC22_9CAUD|nr:HTH DNA binding protein [Lactococcus phage 936 group phage Phi4.2]ALM64140.1 HNH endonuclease [Lactococcus phage 936 group phage Phi4.2]
MQCMKIKKKKVLWNGTIYDSATELSYYLGLKRNACCESIRAGRKLKGHYAKYI